MCYVCAKDRHGSLKVSRFHMDDVRSLLACSSLQGLGLAEATVEYCT